MGGFKHHAKDFATTFPLFIRHLPHFPPGWIQVTPATAPFAPGA
jgi:hypothetical protein